MNREEGPAPSGALPPAFLYPIFFLSGGAAMLYQLVWQRSLFTIYGTSTESVTMVVTAFLLGLGLGSLAGGWISRRPAVPLLELFGGVELAIGFFGFGSPALFRWVSGFTVRAVGWEVGLVALGCVFVPTMLMGVTLPLLVAHQVKRLGNVGRSVGLLYFANTVGSAGGAFLAALVLMGALGKAATVFVAAVLNLTVAAAVLGAGAWRWRRR